MPIYFNLSAEEFPLGVDSIGNRWKQETVQRQKGYSHYHWLQTERGRGIIEINGELLPMPEGAGVLIAPFIPHAYHADQSEWKTSFVTFSGKLEGYISKIVGNRQFVMIESSLGASFQSWINKTISLYETQQIDQMQLSIDCYAFLMRFNGKQEQREFLGHPLYQRYVAPIIKEIETNYVQDITVRNLADLVYVSPQYLSRLFQRFLGCSPYIYLTNYRLVKAKELLANRTDLAISQISFRIGYHDTSHFIAVFKNATGYTPLEFRQLHR